MTPDLQTTNTWLAILAIAGALQSLLLLGTAFGLFRIYRRTASALEALEKRHLAPISARASLCSIHPISGCVSTGGAHEAAARKSSRAGTPATTP